MAAKDLFHDAVIEALEKDGWTIDGDDYIFQCLFHLDIVDSKIWIQRNTTEVFIAEELVRLGVEKSDIVLGLKHPSLRPFTEYAPA